MTEFNNRTIHFLFQEYVSCKKDVLGNLQEQIQILSAV